MTVIFNVVKKFAWLAIVILIVADTASPACGQSAYVVQPVQEVESVSLLAAGAWPLQGEHTELMFKLAYIRGLLDAWQLSSLMPKASSQVLHDLQGLSIMEVVGALDNYYAQTPQNQQIPPSSFILRILPQLRRDGREDNE
jgi:hypothetical protein